MSSPLPAHAAALWSSPWFAVNRCFFVGGSSTAVGVSGDAFLLAVATEGGAAPDSHLKLHGTYGWVIVIQNYAVTDTIV